MRRRPWHRLPAVWRAAVARLRRRPEADRTDRSTAHDVRQRPEDVREYWTEERMREARPAPMPKDD